MRHPRVVLLFLSFGLFAAGCFPYRFTIVPGATGEVVDAQSGAPLSGALVTLTDRYRPDRYEITGLTMADGRFEIPAKQGWGVVIAPFDPLPVTALVTVQADGYQQAEKKISMTTMGPAITNLGKISMTRGTQ
jgi:hypothetical protein